MFVEARAVRNIAEEQRSLVGPITRSIMKLKGAYENENDFVRDLHDYLLSRGWISFPQNSHVAHGNSRYVPGTPDIIAFRPGDGVAFGFECKMPGAWLNENQQQVYGRFCDAGFDALYIVSFPDTAEGDITRAEAIE